MNPRKAIAIVAVLPIVAQCGGSQNAVREISNSNRVAVDWAPDSGILHCVEFAGPAGNTNSKKFELKVPTAAGVNPELKFNTSTDISQIYTVSDILQFGHASLYRLCEAQANGFLRDGGYEELFNGTMKSTRDLLEIQISSVPLQLTRTRVKKLKDLESARVAWEVAVETKRTAFNALLGLTKDDVQQKEKNKVEDSLIIRRALEEEAYGVGNDFRPLSKGRLTNAQQQRVSAVTEGEEWKKRAQAVTDAQHRIDVAKKKVQELEATVAGLDQAIIAALEDKQHAPDASADGGTPAAVDASRDALPNEALADVIDGGGG